MKTLKISCVLVFIIGSGILLSLQDVPEKVKAAFTRKFPNAIAVRWEQESEVEWEADFWVESTSYSASYLQDGTWLETAYEIDKKNIPKHIMTTLAAAFPNYKLEESEALETKAGRAYEFELEYGNIEIEVIMDFKGKILNTVENSDDVD